MRRWIPGLPEQGAEPIRQDDVAGGLGYAAAHPEGIAQRQLVTFLFQNAAARFGDARLHALAMELRMLDWWSHPWEGFRLGSRTPNWCKKWVKAHDLRLALEVAIEDERLPFATGTVMGGWFERFGLLHCRVRPRLRFNVDEAMLAIHLGLKVVVRFNQRLFRKK